MRRAAITKTLYRTAQHWGKVKYRTTEDFRTLPTFRRLIDDEIVCLLDMLDYLKYKHIYFYMKVLIFSY